MIQKSKDNILLLIVTGQKRFMRFETSINIKNIFGLFPQCGLKNPGLRSRAFLNPFITDLMLFYTNVYENGKPFS